MSNQEIKELVYNSFWEVKYFFSKHKGLYK